MEPNSEMDVSDKADVQVLTLVERELEMGFFEQYNDLERPELAMSCKRISHCSCNCDRCTCIFDFR